MMMLLMMMLDTRRHSTDIIVLMVFFLRFGKVFSQVFSMHSQGQMYVLNAGEAVSLECEFTMERFNLFNNPILWQKIQYHEVSEINIMGHVKEPFVSTGKFDVSYHPVRPRYMLGLTIKNLSLEDSGNYTCEVMGPKSALLGHVTHKIFVRAPVIDVSIVQDNSTYIYEHGQASAHALAFVENKARSISCTAKGGNPPPDIEITIGRLDVSDRFTHQLFPKLSGAKGFRLMQTTSVVTAANLVVGHRDDGKRLKCRVTVPGLGSQTALAKIQVSYAPTIFCETAVAFEREKNVYLSCDVRARPNVNILFWMLDGNGTVVTEGDVVNEYWVVNSVQGEVGIQTKLYIREARPESFRTYTIVAENGVGSVRRHIQLHRKYPDIPQSSQTVTGQEQKYQQGDDSNRQNNEYNGFIFLPNTANKQNTLCAILLYFTLVLHHISFWMK